MTGPILRRAAILGMPLAALGMFALAASAFDRFAGDAAATSWVQSGATAWLDTAMEDLSALSNPLLVVTIAALVSLALFLRGMRTASWVMAAAIVAGSGLAFALKEAVARPRPSAEMVRILTDTDGYSFPSGTVTQWVVLLGTLAFVISANVRSRLRRRIIHVSAAFALVVIGFSRIYLGAHWPSDVIGGYSFGGAIVAGSVWLLGRRTGGGGLDGLPASPWKRITQILSSRWPG